MVDFIFGASVAVFDSCIIYAKTRFYDGKTTGYITAANTSASQPYGYVFRDCVLPTNRGITQHVLGRPWGNACGSNPVSFPKVVWLNSTMGSSIKPTGWQTWDACTDTNSVFYAEY